MFELTKYVAIDTETTGLNTETDRPFCATLCNMKGETLYLDLEDEINADWGIIEDLFTGDEVSIPVFHNAKFDMKMLENIGIGRPHFFEDTMLMAHLLDEYQSVSLDNLSKRHLNAQKYTNDELQKWKRNNREEIKRSGYLEMPRHLLEPYALYDTVLTLKLFFVLNGEMGRRDSTMHKSYEFEKSFMHCLIETERTGMYVNTKKGLATLKEWFAREEGLEEHLREMGVGNPRSPFQVKDALHLSGLAVASTDKKTLLGVIANGSDTKGGRLASSIIDYRRAANLTSKVLIPILQGVNASSSRIHTNFNQCRTKTGRLASADPNLTNLHRPDPDVPTSLIPRHLFSATPGWHLEGADYDQMEMRIIADVTGDKGLIDLFASGEDPYVKIAKWVWSGQEITKRLRYIAKQSTLGAAYGMGANRFVEQAAGFGVAISIFEAKDVLARIKDAFPMVPETLKRLEAETHSKGYIVDRYGRHYHVPKDFAYKTLNAEVQGTAAGVVKRVWKRLRAKTTAIFRTLNSMHDEFLNERHHSMDKHTAQAIIVTTMESENHRFRVPLTATPKEYGETWGDVG